MSAPVAFFRTLAGLILLVSALAGCGERDAGPRPLVVMAASSMQEAMEDTATAWEAQGHAAPSLSFAASSALARQIEQGAPGDLFVSADEDWADALEGQGLLRPGTRGDLAGNRLVVVARKGGPAPGLEELGAGRLALADPAAVPAGRYARAALETLNLWDRLAANVVPAENVRAALALVERGEAELGMVYATDALASDRVEVVARLPAGSHPPIRYPVAILAGSTHPEAQAFRRFLDSDEVRDILARRGFTPAE